MGFIGSGWVSIPEPGTSTCCSQGKKKMQKKKMDIRKPGRMPSPDTHSASSLILGFLPPEL